MYGSLQLTEHFKILLGKTWLFYAQGGGCKSDFQLRQSCCFLSMNSDQINRLWSPTNPLRPVLSNILYGAFRLPFAQLHETVTWMRIHGARVLLCNFLSDHDVKQRSPSCDQSERSSVVLVNGWVLVSGLMLVNGLVLLTRRCRVRTLDWRPTQPFHKNCVNSTTHLARELEIIHYVFRMRH